MQDQDPQRIPGQYGLDEIKANRLAHWPNPHPERDYVTHFEIPEFTCLCPRSGFPDFATIVIDYVSDKYIVELKSLKLYINGYRDRQISHESVTNTILKDLVALLAPRWIRVVGDFTVRATSKRSSLLSMCSLTIAGLALSFADTCHLVANRNLSTLYKSVSRRQARMEYERGTYATILDKRAVLIVSGGMDSCVLAHYTPRQAGICT